MLTFGEYADRFNEASVDYNFDTMDRKGARILAQQISQQFPDVKQTVQGLSWSGLGVDRNVIRDFVKLVKKMDIKGEFFVDALTDKGENKPIYSINLSA